MDMHSYGKEKYESLVSKILSLYKLQPVQILPPSMGYRNKSFPIHIGKDKWVNVIIFKAEQNILSRIHAAHLIGTHLHHKGMNVRYPVEYNGKTIVTIQHDGIPRYAALYNYLSGSTIPWEGYTSKHIKLTGGMMGKMHAELEDLSSKKLPDGIKELELLCRNMIRYFSDAEVRQALLRKLGLIIDLSIFNQFKIILQRVQAYPRQALHLDFVRGNILFEEKPQLRIAGIIDFEKASSGPRILDIARTLAFLIVDGKYLDEQKIRKYFLYNGYLKRGKNTLPDLNLLEELLNFYWIYDFYKFLKHNPYESLHLNEHFIRTRNILVQRKMIVTN